MDLQQKEQKKSHSICVTGASLKIFCELTAESSLWHLQCAGLSGCYVGKDPGHPGEAGLSSAGQYTWLALSKGWLSCSTNSSDLPHTGSSPVQLSTLYCIL